MPDELNYKISQLLDNELGKDEALKLLRHIGENPELEKTMRNYDVVSQTIKNEVFLPVSNDFVSRINQQIQQEPVYFLPEKKRIKRRYINFTAIAASIAIVAVMVTKGLYNTPLGIEKTPLVLNEVRGVYQNDVDIAQSNVQVSSEKPVGLMVAENKPAQNADINTQLGNDTQAAQMAENSRSSRKIIAANNSRSVDSRFNDYLDAHSGNMFSSGATYQAFAEVANFEQ